MPLRGHSFKITERNMTTFYIHTYFHSMIIILTYFKADSHGVDLSHATAADSFVSAVIGNFLIFGTATFCFCCSCKQNMQLV